MKFIFPFILLSGILYANSSYYQNGKLVNLTPALNSRTLSNSVQYYETRSGNRIGVKDGILVKCNQDIDCMNILKQYNFNNISKVTSTIFLITINNSDDIFKISRDLYHDKKIKFAHPNFIKIKQQR